MTVVGLIGRRAEAKMHARLGGRLTLASGAHPGDKGDMEYPRWTLELKATTLGAYRLQHEDLCKISQEARAKNRYPAFALAFVSDSGEPLPHGAWVAIPDWAWAEMCRDYVAE